MIAVLGNLTRDRLGGGAPRVGGGPYYAARALRMLGRPAVVVARCADADREELAPHLEALGVPVRWRSAQTTPAFSFTYEGDRRTMTVDAVADPWPEERLPRGAGWVHVAALGRGEFSADRLAQLAHGRRLSLDGQGLARPRRTGPLELDADYDRALLDHVSFLKLAEDEAEAVAGGLEERSLRALGVPEVIVTLGSRGCVVCTEGVFEHVATTPLAGDATGAGDAFAASYVSARDAGEAPLAAAWAACKLVARLMTA